MDKMEIKVIIRQDANSTDIKVSIDGKASTNGIVHAVSEYLLAIKKSTNLSIVTDGIEEFCERLGKDDE